MRQALPAIAMTLACALGATAPAGAAGPQVWGSPYGQQAMLQCLRDGGQVSTAASGAITCCVDDRCIACDGANTCQVTIVGIPGDIATPPASQAPAYGSASDTTPMMQLELQD